MMFPVEKGMSRLVEEGTARFIQKSRQLDG